MARRPLPSVEGAAVERGVVPGVQKVVPAVDFQPPVLEGAVLNALPDPDGPAEDSPELTKRERDDFARCEQALRDLNVAFWRAGRALEAISKRGYYRENYATFAEFLKTWDIGTSQAYRLIESWRLGERLSLIGDTTPNLAQAQKLVPLAKQHGEDAAVMVYKAVAETGAKVTAAVLEGAVGVLPEGGEFDQEMAVEQIRAYLAGELQPSPAVPASPEERAVQVGARIQRMLSPKLIRSVPKPARKELAERLRELAKQLEDEGE